jgi:hypothetical protein
MTPVWKNEDLEGAVIGAIFCVEPTLRYWIFFPGCRPPLSRYRSIGKLYRDLPSGAWSWRY